MSETVQAANTEVAATLTFRAIERRSATELSYPLFLKEYLERDRPVIITNAVPQWNALRRWTPEYFKDLCGDRMVNVSYDKQMPMTELIDGVLASTPEKPGPYLHKVIIYRDMPELLPDLFPDNAYAFPRRYAGTLMPKRFQRPDGFLKLLIGGAGGKFPLVHYDADNSHAMITEIYGDKEFLLFAPEDTPYMYPVGDSSHVSAIENPGNPDLEKYPLFGKAQAYRGSIHPGEAIFIPAGWWHGARTLNPSISVCANMMYRSNWPGFIKEACDPLAVSSAPQRLLKRVYLHGLGGLLTALESTEEAFPGTFIARMLGKISPLSRQAMASPVPFPFSRRSA